MIFTIVTEIIIFKVGEHAIDYANVAQKEKLSELQLRVRQLLDQVSYWFHLHQNSSSFALLYILFDAF